MSTSIKGFNAFLLILFFVGVGKLAFMSGAPSTTHAPGLVTLPAPVITAPINESAAPTPAVLAPTPSEAAPAADWN